MRADRVLVHVYSWKYGYRYRDNWSFGTHLADQAYGGRVHLPHAQLVPVHRAEPPEEEEEEEEEDTQTSTHSTPGDVEPG